jgi:hypothetical protein
MAALSAAWNVLLLDSRLRGNDEANGLFWFETGKSTLSEQYWDDQISPHQFLQAGVKNVAGRNKQQRWLAGK